MPLVAAFACAHTPQLLIRPPSEDRALVLRVHAAFAEVKRRLVAVRPDVICIVGGDHVEGFFLNSVPALAVFVGRQASGEFGRYRYTFDVHEPLARAIVEQGIEAGFDLTYSQELPLDYVPFGDCVTISLEYGAGHDAIDPFDVGAGRDWEADTSHDDRYLHPVIRRRRDGEVVATCRLPEDICNDWVDDKLYREPLRAFLEEWL